MDELVTKISAATGLAPQKAEQALGIMLNLVKTQGNQNKVAELFAKLPGADALVAKHGGDGASSGGLLGMLAGGMMGGPLAAVRDGDRIVIDIPKRSLRLDVGDAELAARLRTWKRPAPKFRHGYLALYARLAESADKGAIIRHRDG